MTDMTRDKQNWPLTMTEASHIARLPRHAGSDADIAKEYGVSEQLIRQIRSGEGYKGVRLS
jgi:hypothetical protein